MYSIKISFKLNFYKKKKYHKQKLNSDVDKKNECCLKWK